MTVLVTRPAPQGEHLCQQLQQAGVATCYQPLIQFCAGRTTDLQQQLQSLAPTDFVIAVSQPAVRYSDQQVAENGGVWPTHPKYLAIGQHTAQLLSHKVGQAVLYPETSDSEHLLALPELQQVAGHQVLILRGQQGRELLAETLQARGAHVRYCDVYQRQPIHFDGMLQVHAWRQLSVTALLVTSGEQLIQFLSCIPASEHSWVFAQSLFVPSQRIAKQAKSCGFQRIINVGSASNDQLLAAILAHLNRSTS